MIGKSASKAIGEEFLGNFELDQQQYGCSVCGAGDQMAILVDSYEPFLVQVVRYQRNAERT
jgi:hypothetical protein